MSKSRRARASPPPSDEDVRAASEAPVRLAKELAGGRRTFVVTTAAYQHEATCRRGLEPAEVIADEAREMAEGMAYLVEKGVLSRAEAAEGTEDRAV